MQEDDAFEVKLFAQTGKRLLGVSGFSLTRGLCSIPPLAGSMVSLKADTPKLQEE